MKVPPTPAWDGADVTARPGSGFPRGPRRASVHGSRRSNVERYDVVVIGGGWGGYTAAVRAARHGLRVALIDRDKLGGTCLHRGCIPTKVLLQTADLLATARQAEEFGVRLPAPELDYARVRRRKDDIVGRLHRGLHTLVRAHEVRLIAGNARLVSPTRVQVDGFETIEAGSVIVATGSRPRELPGFAFDGRLIVSSDDVLEMERVPRSIVILGAGAVGVEFASCYADYGAEVTLVELLPRILPQEDGDVSTALTRSFTARGIRVLTGAVAVPESLTRTEGGLRVTVAAGEARHELAAEALLVAVGRAPVTDGLGLEELGVAMARGVVQVDERMRTSVPGLYAVGDVTGGLLLAHVAAAEGALAADTIAGVPAVGLEARRLPRATYCRPQVASIGLTEDEARAAGHQVRTARAHLRANGRALIAGEPEGFVKLVSDESTGDVLGVHILGTQATELIAEIALGQLLDVAVWEVAAAVHPHPTLSEAIGEAAQAALRPARMTAAAP
jgi:dihydrolipoamide dehydrogenase